MTIAQFAYDIPDHIWAGLENGELSRFGSVVRDRARIVEHLKEVPLPAKPQRAALGGIAGAAKTPVVAIGLGAVVVAGAVAGAAIWVAGRKRRSTVANTPKCVDKYNASLKAYLTAIHSGNLDADTVNRLLEALEAIKADFDSGKISIDLLPRESEALVDLVADYTRKLAEANCVEVGEPEVSTVDALDKSIIDLRHYLEIQRKIFNRAA